MFTHTYMDVRMKRSGGVYGHEESDVTKTCIGTHNGICSMHTQLCTNTKRTCVSFGGDVHGMCELTVFHLQAWEHVNPP